MDPGQMDSSRDEMVRILMRLTVDLERFETIVRDQRRLVEEGSRGGAHDDGRIRKETRRIAIGAQEIETSARSALDELRRMSQEAAPSSSRMPPHRRRAGGAS